MQVTGELNMDSSPEKTSQASESMMGSPTSESEMATPTKEEIPSFIGILDLAWVKFKKGLYKRLTEAGQHHTKAEKPCSSSPHGLMFLKAISWIQLVLGFLCICLAVIAVAAAFQTREAAAYDYVYTLSSEMLNFYRKHLTNATNKAEEKIKSILENNCSDDGSSFVVYPYRQYYDYNLGDYYNDAIPNYCRKHDCFGDHTELDSVTGVKGYHLIIDYLATPSWTGILLIITSMVGFRLASLWNKAGYIQVSYSHTILNTLCFFVFAPVMMAAGILQTMFSDDYNVMFRHIVGTTTAAFAGVVMLLSFLVCVINCCCPIHVLEENHYKRFTEDMTPKENQNDQADDDSDIIIA